MLNKNKKNAVVTAFLSVLRKQILTIVLYLAETEGVCVSCNNQGFGILETFRGRWLHTFNQVNSFLFFFDLSLF